MKASDGVIIQPQFFPTDEVLPQQQSSTLKKVISSCMIGNALEWYDFALYGHFATIISKLFFPSTDHFASLMATFGVFAAGFIMRPLGAIIFGHIGDKIGRKNALLWSIYLMTIPTFLIGLLPTYTHIGWLAPVLLTIIRLLQGISMGGEFTGSMIFIVEHSKNKKRGFSGSWAPFSLLMGVLVGSAIAMLTTMLLSLDDLHSWGWRIPFLLSIVGGFIGSYMRRTLADPETFEKMKKKHTTHATPVIEVFKHHTRKIFLVLFVDLLVAIGFFMTVSFVVSHLSAVVGVSKSWALIINTCSMIACAIVIPFSGWLTDKIGRKPVMMGAASAFAVLAYPLFLGFSAQGIVIPLMSHVTMGIILGFYFGPISAVLVEIFPASVRYSGISLAHNLSMAIFGGTLPTISLGLIQLTNNHAAPAFYLILAAIISFSGLYFMKDRYKEKID